jgi:short-subunit dehydrogenase involved in D-alanine esterification of teichoic acids
VDTTDLTYALLSFCLSRLFHKSEKFLTARPVFITGCDSGFGKELAIRMANRGMKVYAACLTDKGVENIRTQVGLYYTGSISLMSHKSCIEI